MHYRYCTPEYPPDWTATRMCAAAHAARFSADRYPRGTFQQLGQIIRPERPAVLHHDHIIVIVVGILIFCPARLLILLRRLQHIAQCIRQVQRARRGRRFRAFLDFLLPACVRVFSIVMVWCSRSISLHRRPHSSPRRSPRYAQIYIGNSSRVPTALASRTPSCSGV